MSLVVPQEGPCPFCQYLDETRSAAFVARGEIASAFVNPTQYGHGALLVVPNRHVTTILDARAAEVEAVARLAQRVSRALAHAFAPVGLNVFQNNGRASGQHVPHYHVHVVPRYDATEPSRLFRARDFPFLEAAELDPVAAEIRRALAETAEDRS